jgi:hypothetical protein
VYGVFVFDELSGTLSADNYKDPVELVLVEVADDKPDD